MSRNRGLLIGVTAVGAIVAAEIAGYGPFSNSQGVKNIEDRYSSGGGSKQHLPGYASKTGDSEQVTGRSEKEQGYGNPSFSKEFKQPVLSKSDTRVSTAKKREDLNTPAKDESSSDKRK